MRSGSGRDEVEKAAKCRSYLVKTTNSTCSSSLPSIPVTSADMPTPNITHGYLGCIVHRISAKIR